MDERKPEFYGPPDAENLHDGDEDEAIERILDNYNEEPETIEVAGYARMEPDFEFCHPLDDVIEQLDQDYGNPEEATEPTEAMIEAEKAFMAVIEREYKPWACEEISRRTVNVAEWRKEHP